MRKGRRVIALLLALAAGLVMLSSAVYLVSAAGHDCVGENCPICCRIGMCENTLKALGLAVAAAALSCAPISPCRALPVRLSRLWSRGTLTTLKVKLSN